MELFRTDNTEYDSIERTSFNAEWDEIVETESLEEYTEKYDIRSKEFCDEISRR